MSLPEHGDSLERLREREIEEIRSAPVCDERKYGDLSPPAPAASGARYFNRCPWRLTTASKNVCTCGTLRKSTKLSDDSIAFLEYRMVLENDGPACEGFPMSDGCSFNWVRTVMEIVETFVPTHLRGHRLGDGLVVAALGIELHPPRVAREIFNGTARAGEWDGDEINQGAVPMMRPTCTFVSGSFLARHPEYQDRVEFYSGTLGRSVTWYRRNYKKRSVAQLARQCEEKGLVKMGQKACLIERLIRNDVGPDAYNLGSCPLYR
jgi:predicted GNAT family acetyltransferase